MGIPEEILTDQGSNFQSRLLRQLYRLLRVDAIRTSLYHPQTDGLVERFNQTLKAMLRKFASTEGKDWDKLLSFLLRVNWLLSFRTPLWLRCQRATRHSEFVGSRTDRRTEHNLLHPSPEATVGHNEGSCPQQSQTYQ